jgi:hypothetical protein
MSRHAIPLGDIERHFWLTRSVAKAMGVNLSEAMAERRLSTDDYANMVTRCRAAGCQDACQRWLAAQTGPRAEGPPEYCANANIHKQLRP